MRLPRLPWQQADLEQQETWLRLETPWLGNLMLSPRAVAQET